MPDVLEHLRTQDRLVRQVDFRDLPSVAFARVGDAHNAADGDDRLIGCRVREGLTIFSNDSLFRMQSTSMAAASSRIGNGDAAVRASALPPFTLSTTVKLAEEGMRDL